MGTREEIKLIPPLIKRTREEIKLIPPLIKRYKEILLKRFFISSSSLFIVINGN
jgi:hypothetical protein